jgi:transposase
MTPSGEGNLLRRLEQLERENRLLRQQLQRALEENERLKQEHAHLRQEIERLRRQLEEALRAAKRQAAPFSRGQPKPNPKPPGRKAGSDYGRHHCRPLPRRVDERIAVPLPARCPGCGGPVAFERTEPQYQEDIVRRTVVRRFDVAVGRCCQCGRRVQGRHPLQTSDALGAAQVQLGPEAVALAAQLNKQMGLSLGHTVQVLKLGFGLQASRAGICRALARLAAKVEPTYHELLRVARASLVNGMDETGWRVGGRLQWMWVAVSAQVTIYRVLPGRGFAEAALLLGADYSGWLVHDGLRCYYGFELAFHQSCLAHLLRRCRDLVQVASPSAARFPLQVRSLLEKALALRERYEQGLISLHGLWTAAGRLEARLDRLLARPYRTEANRRLAQHLRHEQPHLFTFLDCPGLEATNNAAERALRGVVIARKVWGGNRTWNGARTQGILTSVLRTCWQQGQDAFALLVGLLRSPAAQVLDILPNGRSP